MYEQLGKIEGPSILGKVLLAFLMPMLVFIVSLVMFEKIFSGIFDDRPSYSVLSFVSAFVLTFICVIITKLINSKFGQSKREV